MADSNDRDNILRRRARFLALALAGTGVPTACGGEAPPAREPSVDVAPPPPPPSSGEEPTALPQAPAESRDRDGDGIVDADDECAREPEDLDDIADHDGCPEEDADRDGIADTADDCPTEPGGHSGNGCPIPCLSIM